MGDCRVFLAPVILLMACPRKGPRGHEELFYSALRFALLRFAYMVSVQLCPYVRALFLNMSIVLRCRPCPGGDDISSMAVPPFREVHFPWVCLGDQLASWTCVDRRLLGSGCAGGLFFDRLHMESSNWHPLSGR